MAAAPIALATIPARPISALIIETPIPRWPMGRERWERSVASEVPSWSGAKRGGVPSV